MQLMKLSYTLISQWTSSSMHT